MKIRIWNCYSPQTANRTTAPVDKMTFSRVCSISNRNQKTIKQRLTIEIHALIHFHFIKRALAISTEVHLPSFHMVYGI